MSHTHPAVEPPLTAEQLPDDLATLKNMILELLVSMHQRDRDHQAMQHRLELLLRRLYGPRGERFNPNQLLLFPDLPADAARGESPADLRGEAQAEVPAAWSPPSAGESATCA